MHYGCSQTENSMLTDVVSGDIICTECGMVVCSRLVVETAEWRSFEDSNPSKADMCRASSVSKTGSAGTVLTVGGSDKYKTAIARANSTVKPAYEKQLDSTVALIRDFSSKLNVTEKIVDRAINIIVMAVDNDIVKTRSRESVAAAILYIACSTEGYPRTINEVSKFTFVEKKQIGRMSSTLMMALGLKKYCVQPESIIHRIASQLQVCYTTAEFAREMCLLVAERQLVGNAAPQVVAAACLLIVSRIIGPVISFDDLEKVTMAAKASIIKMECELNSYIDVIKPAKLKNGIFKDNTPSQLGKRKVDLVEV
jgi:transcription initiation factor TFIIB